AARQRASEPELLPLPVEGARVDSEDLGGSLEAGGVAQDAADVFGFQAFEADLPSNFDRAAGEDPRLRDPFGQVGETDLGTLGQDRGAFDRVPQLAEVPGP